MSERSARSMVDVADDLAERVDVLARALRWWRVVTALVVVALVVAGFAVWQNREAWHESCQRDNQLRQVELDLWRPILLDEAPPVPGADATDTERREYERFVKFETRLEDGFALHGC